MENKFNLIVIGSGPGGYTAAIRASQLGYTVAIIEKYSTLGGTCTNVGCIPTKALLDSSEHFHTTRHKLARHGIVVAEPTLDFSLFMKRKEQVIRQNTSGLDFLMKKNKIRVFKGHASFVDDHTVRVTSEGPDILLQGDYIIIATGSKPSTIKGVTIDKDRIITSTEALSLKELPADMVILGGGVIGVEMASLFSRIGTRVTIFEYAGNLIPAMDEELGKELGKILSRQEIDIRTSYRVQEVINTGNRVKVRFLDSNGEPGEVTADYCLVAVGREPYTAGLGLEHTSIKLDKRGRIIVNDSLQAGPDHIYAIGDVVAGPMLAHKAEEEAVFAVENIHGHSHQVNYNLIPGVVYTWPEIASVGSTEKELRDSNTTYKVGKFPFMASGRARASSEPDGFVKVLSDPRYGMVYGVHVIGPRAADLIASAVIGMYHETTDKDMFRMPYAHPTYSEALKEAFLQASGQGSLNL